MAVLFLAACLTFLFTTHVGQVKCHGRLVDPPGRSSMWRYGWNTPMNFDDHDLSCGGKHQQWHLNNGRCGVCGDPIDGPRLHEAGGKYATGIIVKTYTMGEVITVTVQLVHSLMGWFEFRLCPNNNPVRRVTQECLDRYLLKLTDGGTRYHIHTWNSADHNVTLQLPEGLTCKQCVLQWKYNTGSSWGCTRDRECCLGCGPQSQYYACADIAIDSR